MPAPSSSPSVARSRGLRAAAGAVFGFSFAVATVVLARTPDAPRNPSSSASAGSARTPPPVATAPGPASGADAGLALEAAAAEPIASPATLALTDKAARIRALIAGELDTKTSARALFDIELDDEHALRLEAARLRVLRPAPAAASASSQRQKKESRSVPPVDAGSDADSDAGTTGSPPEVGVSNEELDARLDLDRARLGFYELPPGERKRLLEEHAARQEREPENKAGRQLDAAEQKARQAQLERTEALEAAREARTEALRLIAEEQARLSSVAQRQAEFEQALLKTGTELAAHEEKILGWHRRIRDAVERASRGEMPPEAVDRLYAELRKDLRGARDRLAAAIAATNSESRVPVVGDDPLSALPSEMDRSAPAAKRAEIERETRRLVGIERNLRVQGFRAHYEHVVSLNRDRLALYPFLSGHLRDGIAGFGPAGIEQARAELRQVTLVLRHHLIDARAFVGWLVASGGDRGAQAAQTGFVALKWLIAVAVFIAWRRRATGVIESIIDSARQERSRAREVERAPIERVLAFVLRVRKPVELLLLFAAIFALLPAHVRSMLEVELASTVFVWTFGGAAVVSAIDALADERLRERAVGRMQVGPVRLRSLRLIGRVVVAVALILSVSQKLVGRGTIYDWVLSTCWFAVFPLTLVLVRWWREIIFERIAQKRRKTDFDRWVLRRQSGLRGLGAGFLGGAGLILEWSARTARRQVTRFNLTRRVLAYLFRRDMSRRADATQIKLERVPDNLFEALGPMAASREIVLGVADIEVERILARIGAQGGGVFAVVGERGSGKTTLLRRILAQSPRLRRVECPAGGLALFTAELARALSLPEQATLEDEAAVLDGAPGSGLLVDDAQRLIQLKMGGLQAFDEVMSVARQRSTNCSWVFTFDQVVWRFIERARGARPLFDEVVSLEPWTEEAIARLLVGRSHEVGIKPTFRNLLSELSEDADELEVQEATDGTAAAYYRLIWDYAAGNPGIALHAWRLCLGGLANDELAVKVFDAPDSRELETLPDSAVFVMRAIVQLELASFDDIAQVTMLRGAEVQDALRYGLARGYFALRGSDYWVTWGWFRPITRFLQRRYLLAGG